MDGPDNKARRGTVTVDRQTNHLILRARKSFPQTNNQTGLRCAARGGGVHHRWVCVIFWGCGGGLQVRLGVASCMCAHQLFIITAATIPPPSPQHPKKNTGYSKLANILSKDALYYALVAPFFLFYLVFDVFIYPNRHRLHPAASAAPPPPLEVRACFVVLGVCLCMSMNRSNTYTERSIDLPSVRQDGAQLLSTVDPTRSDPTTPTPTPHPHPPNKRNTPTHTHIFTHTHTHTYVHRA